jgi:hypothetical protein
MAIQLILLIAALIAFILDTIGNPGGRPKADGDLRELARRKCPKMLDVLVAIAEDEQKPSAARVTAASAVLDRGYGKPPSTLADGDGNPIEWMDFLLAARSRYRPDDQETVQ